MSLRGRGFAAIVILTLALGIGATTAIFSVVNGVLLRPLPLRDPQRLVLLGELVPQIPMAGFDWIDNPTAFRAWRQHASDFSALSALVPGTFNLVGAGAPRLLKGARASTNLFALLEVRAQLGRTFVPGDEASTVAPMVITDQLWRSAFDSDPGVIGRSVGSGTAQATIVGVLPPSFDFGGRELGPIFPTVGTDAIPDYFVPLQWQPMDLRDDVFSDFNYTVLGRLAPGVTVAQAKAQLDGIQANLARTAPEKLKLFADVTTLKDYTVAAAAQELWLLLAGVGAVLLIVCVNLGGLWLTRLADRRRDWAIRAALGASPGRLARQVLMESVRLGLIGGVCGLGLAALGMRTLLATAPANLPRLNDVHLDLRVLAFGLLLAFLAGLAAGWVPALRLARSDPQSSLKAGGAATTTDRAGLRLRQILIGAEAALCTLLLAVGGLLGLSFYRLVTQPTGFNAGRALAADVVLSPATDAAQTRLLGQITDAVAALPGVQAAALTSRLPLTGETWIDSATVPGRVISAAATPRVNVRFISPGFFRALGVPLLAGRDYALSDKGRPVAVISRAAVGLLWPGQSPDAAVGRQLTLEGDNLNVIGVADDARALLSSPAPAVVYQPYWVYPPRHLSIVIRTPLSVAAIAGPLRAAIWRLAPDAPIPTLRPLGELATSAVAPQRYQLLLVLLFALAALALAGLGVYALVAHSVARRSKELGIRMALGARASHLWSLVLTQGLAPVAAGVVAGLAAALAAGRLLASLLFQVSPANPLVLASVGALVLLCAACACILPARRATTVDPLSALRAE